MYRVSLPNLPEFKSPTLDSARVRIIPTNDKSESFLRNFSKERSKDTEHLYSFKLELAYSRKTYTLQPPNIRNSASPSAHRFSPLKNLLQSYLDHVRKYDEAAVQMTPHPLITCVLTVFDHYLRTHDSRPKPKLYIYSDIQPDGSIMRTITGIKRLPAATTTSPTSSKKRRADTTLPEAGSGIGGAMPVRDVAQTESPSLSVNANIKDSPSSRPTAPVRVKKPRTQRHGRGGVRTSLKRLPLSNHPGNHYPTNVINQAPNNNIDIAEVSGNRNLKKRAKRLVADDNDEVVPGLSAE